MTYRMFKGGNEKVSLLGMGCMRLPTAAPGSDEIDYAKAEEIIDFAYQNGVNYFDTAYFYHAGGSEAFTGKALAKYPRNSYYLATKLPFHLLEKEADVERLFNEQLTRCGVEYFDFYLCHALSESYMDKLANFKVFEKLEEFKQQSKIRRIGFSFHDKPEILDKLCAAHPWEFVQIQANALDWEVYRSREQYEILEKYGLPCIIMEPIRGGRLADLGTAANAMLKAVHPDKSIASWSIRYAASLPNVLTVLSGMSSLAQVQDNISTMQPFEPLDNHERQTFDNALEVYKQGETIGCTACRYCIPCPAGVDIPGVFALYNRCILQRDISYFVEQYAEFPTDKNASHCIQCGQCEAVCPQRLAIPTLLESISAGKTPQVK